MKLVGIALAAMAIVAMQGCNSGGGDITPEMQKAKNDALKKADQKEGSAPPQDRGQN